MNIVDSSRHLRNDRSSQAIGAMEEYMAHGPADHGAPGGPIGCRLPECNGETFPCRRRTALENWLFVPRRQDDVSRVVYRRGESGTGYRPPSPDRSRTDLRYARR